MNHTEVSNRTLLSVLKQRGLLDVCHEVCASSAGRHVESLSDLTDNEVAIVIKDLGTDEAHGRVDFENARHRYILSLCYQLGWTRVNEHLGRVVADNARLGRWLKTRGKYKKPILQHTGTELGTIILAMENMLNNRVK